MKRTYRPQNTDLQGQNQKNYARGGCLQIRSVALANNALYYHGNAGTELRRYRLWLRILHGQELHFLLADSALEPCYRIPLEIILIRKKESKKRKYCTYYCYTAQYNLLC